VIDLDSLAYDRDDYKGSPDFMGDLEEMHEVCS
jgi:hypothetical protein